jgi:uncharacterized membrane protein
MNSSVHGIWRDLALSTFSFSPRDEDLSETAGDMAANATACVATDGDTDASVPDIAIGVVAALVGSTLLSLGMVGMRFAHLRMRPGVSFLTSPRWWLFFALFLLSNGGDLVALSFAPQSVVTPLGSVSLLSNALAARVLLRERLDRPTLVGGILVICGVLSIVFPSLSRSPCSHETVDTLASRWRQPGFISWASVQLVVVSLVLVCVHRIEGRMRSPPSGPRVSEAASTIGRRCCSWLRRGELFDLAQLTRFERRALRLCYVGASGLLASWTVLFIKCAGELAKSFSRDASVDDDDDVLAVSASMNPLADARTYALVIGLLVSVPLQLTNLNKALRHFEAQFVVPSLQAFWSLSSITKGALFFGEFEEYAPRDVGLFSAGVALSLAGVVVLSMRKSERRPESSIAPVARVCEPSASTAAGRAHLGRAATTATAEV